jgi:photosystem II stability/assembly factor-like uncharacterized protein
MTRSTDPLFDQRIADWLNEDPQRAPGSLLGTVLAAIPSTPQRRASRVSWGSGRGRGLTLLAAAALLLVGGALAAGSGLVKLPSVVPPVPAPTNPAAVTSPSPAAETPGPVASPSPAPSDPALAVRPGRLSIGDHRLVSDSVGWVSTSDAIYRTQDLGRTWSAVSPPGRPTGSGSQDLFIDADTAYSFLPGSGTIAATHDGGATWAETVLDGTTDGMAYWFETPQRGSLIFFAGQKSDPSAIFATTDGGLTWTGPRNGPSINSSGIWPGDDNRGLLLARVRMPGGLDLSKAVIQISHDAGATWVNRPYPAIPQEFTGEFTLTPAHIVAAWSDGAGHIVLAIPSIYVDKCVTICQATMLYTSADDGRSWEYVPTAAPIHLSLDTQFLSPTAWVLVSAAEWGPSWLPTREQYGPEFNGQTFTSTVDGGATWRTTTRSSPFPANGVNFATPDIGWAISACEPAASTANDFVCDPTDIRGTNRTILIQTTDGGLTWSSIGE